MTLDEFSRWEDGTDTRYELIDGYDGIDFETDPAS